ncbi:MAG: hypothetical protein WAX07_07400 [Candidatus Altiarchaeia archaeon]
MKKTGYMILAFLALSLFSGYVSADGTNQTDNQTAAFSLELGAKVRLLQLEAAIEKNVLWGERVIAAIKEKNASVDTSSLETLLAELKTLKDEEANTTPEAGDEAAKAFVDMRSDATEITKEFRELVKSLLKESDIQGMRRALGTVNSNKTRELARRINQTRHEYNAEKMAEILTAANITNTYLLEKVRNGSASPGEVKDALKDVLYNMSGKERKDAFNAIGEKNIKAKVFVRAVADKVAYKELERAEMRLDKRLNKTGHQNVSEQVRERLQNKTSIIERRMENIKNRTQGMIGHIGDMTDKKVEKLLDLSDKLEGAGERKTGRLEQRLNDSNLTDEQRNRIDEQISQFENKTDRMQERIEERINKTQGKGEHLMDVLDNKRGGKP